MAAKLTVSVSEEYNEKELEIMIVSSKEKESEREVQKKIKNNERAEKFMRFVGSAKHPDFPMTKYDVYDQQNFC